MSLTAKSISAHDAAGIARPNHIAFQRLSFSGERFQDIVLQMLAKNPDDRCKRPSALLKDLERVGTYAGLEADFNTWSKN